MTDEELRKLAEWVIAETVGSRDAKWQGLYGYRSHHVAKRLLELLPPAGGIPSDIRADAEHVAGCSEDWCHAADESDLFDAVRRGQRVAVAWLEGNLAGHDTSGPPFDAWSFVRDVLSRGVSIEHDSRALGRTYEQFSARLDAVARELADKLKPHLRAHQ